MNKESNSIKVLNMDEVKATANEEKKAKRNKKIPISLIIIGLLFIISGIICIFLFKTKDDSKKKEEVVVNIPVMTCKAVATDQNRGITTDDTVVYNFEDNKLIGYNDTFILGVVADNVSGVTNFASLIGNYEQEKASLINIPGLLVNSEINNEGHIYTLKITVDLKTYDASSDLQTNYIKVNESLGTKYDKVKSDLQTNGYTCE